MRTGALVTTIDEVLADLWAVATDERDKGDRFERLMVAYLKTDPIYVDRFSEVWRWTDWPGREGRPDTGIDLGGCHWLRRAPCAGRPASARRS